jgi:hypothetical protein
MNQTSPASTGTAGAAIAALVVVIDSISKHFGLNLSAQDEVSIAAGIVAGAHWVAQQVAVRASEKNAVAKA